MYYTDTVATHICLLKQFAASKQSKAKQRRENVPSVIITCPLRMPCKLTAMVATLPLVHGHYVPVQLCAFHRQATTRRREETRARRAARLSGAEVCRESASQTARRRNWGRFFSADRTMMWPGRGGGPGVQSERLLRGQIRSAIHGPKKESILYIRLKTPLLSTMWHRFLVH